MVKGLIGQFTLPAWNAIGLLLIGAVLGFAGWKLFSSARKFYGGVMGLTLGVMFSHQEEMWLRAASTISAVIAGAFLSEVVFASGLVVTGAVGATVVTCTTLVNMGVEPALIDLSCAICLLSGGLLALFAPEWSMMVVTSALGAMMGTIGVESLARGSRTPVGTELDPRYALGAALICLLVQVHLHRRTQKTRVLSAVEDSTPLPTPAHRPLGPYNPAKR